MRNSSRRSQIRALSLLPLFLSLIGAYGDTESQQVPAWLQIGDQGQSGFNVLLGHRCDQSGNFPSVAPSDGLRKDGSDVSCRGVPLLVCR